MNNTKKILNHLKRSLLLVAMGCTLVSCFGLLDEKPYKGYDADNYFTSLTNLDMGVLGVYEPLSDLNSYGQTSMVINCNTDESQISAGDPSGSEERALMSYYKILSNNKRLEDIWALYYTGIDRANLIIERGYQVPVANEQEATIKKRYIAEAKFLRGLYYFDLVRIFGPVPLKTGTSKPTDNFNVVRNSTEEVYNRIVEDMTEAANDLQYHDAVGKINARVTKGAALGLLARVYLFRGGYYLNQEGEMVRPSNYRFYYRKAEECIAQIDPTKHKLNASFQTLFENYSKFIAEPQESMFEIEFFNPAGERKHSGFWGTYCGLEVNQSSSYGRANSFIKATKMLYDRFEEGDLRRDISVCTFNINATNEVKAISERLNHQWAAGKWRRTWMTGSVKDLNNTDVNFCLIRYADVLLMDAEIKNELYGGPTEEAFEAVNKVRRRAFGKDVNTPSNIDLDKTEYGSYEKFFEYIYSERSRELSFELTRRLDLIRWNRLSRAISESKTYYVNWQIKWNAEHPKEQATTKIYFAADYFTPGKHELMPVPDRERRETGFTISQNPQY